MFKQRLLTTLVLVPLVLVGIYYVNYFIFNCILLVILALCGFEWLQLIPLTTKQYLLKICFFVVLFATNYLISDNYWVFGELLLWLVIFIFVSQYPKLYKVWSYPIVVAFFGVYLLPFFIHSFNAVFLMDKGKSLIVYVLFLVWAADIGAYLAGKQWGAHKLIPNVSPGKTIEGLMGGVILSLLVSMIGFLILKPDLPLHWFFMSLITFLISLLGDLFISMLKRRVGLKDTGNIIPGHGGVLDRLDSLIAAVPIFYAGLLFLTPGLSL